MEIKGIEADYILHLMRESDKYPVFKIPGAVKVGGQFVMLHDTYTQLNIEPRSRYETTLTDYSAILHRPVDNIDEITEPQPPFITEDNAAESRKDRIKEIDELLRNIPELYSEMQRNANKENGETFVLNEYEEKNGNDKKKNIDDKDIIKRTGSDREQWFEREKYRLYLSAPGGGKSTLLKMYALTYGYQYLKAKDFDFLSDEAASIMIQDYKEGGEYQEILEHYINRIESIWDKLVELEALDICFPIFIEARSLISNIDSDTDFEDILKKSMSNFLYDNNLEEIQSYPDEIDLLYDHADNIVLIIDGLEEFIKSESKDNFLKKLNEYVGSKKKNIKKIIMSSRYKEYQDFEHNSEEEETQFVPQEGQYVIKELYRDFDLITEFTEKWFKSLVLDNDDEIRFSFIDSLRTNDSALNLITNPLELTSLLLVSVSDRFLPSDSAKLYARSIELWLTWANGKRYNLDDVMIQVAHVAYQMAESITNRIKISQENLYRFIGESRDELKRYFRQDWGDDNVEEFVEFLCKSHLLLFSGGTYEFYHRMYQAYFVAYCIKNNLFKKENRKQRRYDYIEKHINNREDFWNSIILLIAILDFDLRDVIIDDLLYKANHLADYSWYCLSILMQLVVVPGINFDNSELKELYKIIAHDNNRPRYISRKRQDICKVLSISEEVENDIFVNVILDEYDSIADDRQKEDYKDAFATCLFFCLWNCKVSDQSIARALKAFFSNYISTNILSEFYNNRKTGDAQSRNLYPILVDLGRDALRNEEHVSDYYMMIAAITGYMDECSNPYDKVLELIKSDDLEKQIIAANILIISAWLIKDRVDEKYGYEWDLIEGKEEAIAQFLNEHIADKNNNFRRDYIVSYLDYYGSNRVPKLVELLTDDDVFESCAQIVIELWKKKKEDGSLKYEDFPYELDYIATYPWETLKRLADYLCGDDEKAAFIEYIEAVLENAGKSDYRTKLEALKLLAIVNHSEEITYKSQMKKIIKENGAALAKTHNAIFANKMLGEVKHDFVREAEKILMDLGIKSNNANTEESVVNVDYYSIGEYEKAKEQYLKTFSNVLSRNNLAYMLRRGEINEVSYNGEAFNVPKLLDEGIREFEPYSLMNYALFLSYEDGRYKYDCGLKFLLEKKEKANLLSTALWWLKLKNENELEGYIVISWLCDLGLYDFDTSSALKEKMQVLFKDKVII